MTDRIIETVVEYEPKAPCRTAAQMEQLCCEETPALQCCEKSVGVWHGATEAELLAKYHPNLDAQGRNEKGEYVVIEIAPRKNPCGEKIIEYDLNQPPCCVDPFEYDDVSSISVLADNASGIVYVDGGVPPFLFRVEGVDFGVDPTLQEESKTQSSRAFTVYTGDACGIAHVTITDSCGESVTGTIYAADGQWTVIPLSEIPSWFREVVADETVYHPGSTQRHTATLGGYRVKQYYTWYLTDNLNIRHTDPCYPGRYDSGSCAIDALRDAVTCKGVVPAVPEATIQYVVPLEFPHLFTRGNYCANLTVGWSAYLGGTQSISYQNLKLLESINIIAEKWTC